MNPRTRARLATWYERWDAWEKPDTLLHRSPAQDWFHRRAATRLAVLGYHGIDDPDRFAAHLDLLHRSFTPVSLPQVEEALRGGPPLPPYSVLITFDDGDRSILTHGLPLLQARATPAVCFAVPSLIGTDQPFWWDEVEHLSRHGGRTPRVPPASPTATVQTVKLLSERDRHLAIDDLRRTATLPAPRRPQLTAPELRTLANAGIAVGNHTLTHPCLDRCDPTQVRTEVLQAHELLTDILGHPPTTFAYPNGNPDPRAHHHLTNAGYHSAFLYNHRLAHPTTDPLHINRLVVTTRTTPARLETILSGLHPAVFRGLRSAARTVARGGQLIAGR